MLCHPEGVNLITPLGWHRKRKIKNSEESVELLLKKKCNTNKDARQNNPVFDQGTAPIY